MIRSFLHRPATPGGEQGAGQRDGVVLWVSNVDGIARQVLEDIADHRGVDDIVVQADRNGTPQLEETAPLDADAIAVAEFNGGLWDIFVREVGLVVVAVVPELVNDRRTLRPHKPSRPANVRQQVVVVDEREAVELQVSDSGGSGPPVDLDQSLALGRKHRRGRHVFAATVVVKGFRGPVEIKLSRRVEQLKGVAECIHIPFGPSQSAPPEFRRNGTDRLLHFDDREAVFAGHVPDVGDVLAPGPAPVEFHIGGIGIDACLRGAEPHSIKTRSRSSAPRAPFP